MVEDQAPIAPCYFTPQRINRWLRDWESLKSLAANPSTARGLLRSGPTPETPKIGASQKGRGHSINQFILIKADIERARTEALVPLGLEWHIVTALTLNWTIDLFTERSGLPSAQVVAAYGVALKQMAVFLGWEGD